MSQFPRVQETPVPGPVPRFEIPDWRERHGVVAGITGRTDPAGSGFDLGLGTDAPVGEVMARWRRFRQAEPGFGATILGYQVHQTRVLWHPGGSGWVIVDGVDGHATRTPGLLLTVTVADCIPVYLLAPKIPAIALLHAGWRGTASGILARGLEVLHEGCGAVPSDIVMHCGVGICGECYEVGSEVSSACGVPAEGPGPWHLDLREVLASQARALGVPRISVSTWCSAHDRDRFFSHRASRGRDGRMVAYLGMTAPEGG
ncbi:MAG TPA: polyphenol oxidase family protein [Gemmatimonadales bacterium]|nr:polyphenol oxidase family protein [Gemmatimonadales bacterium]